MTKRLGERLIRALALLSIVIILLMVIFSFLFSFLSKTERVDANILIVEGWLPPAAIETAYSEFESNDYKYLVTTGLKSEFDGCILYMNGYLVFYPGKKVISQNESLKHHIEVSAYSELNGENAARFSFFINDSLSGEFITEKKEKRYGFYWTGALSDIDSIMIRFTNDRTGDFGDRNLYVRELIIDKKIVIPTLNYSVYDIGKNDGKKRITNNIDSNAERTKKELIALGVDSAAVISAPAKRVKVNRTLTSALAFRDWLKINDIEIKGINIISSGTHARRTWMTFNRVLGKSYNVGIVALPDTVNKTGKKKVRKTLREAIGLIYYWIILLPY